MKTLTKAEEQIMQILWSIEKGFLKDVMEAIPEPKPHNNTISTILKILVEKEFVSYQVFGRQHQYYPLVLKDEYSKGTLKNFVGDYFQGSFKDAVSFLVKKDQLSLDELELLLNELKKK